MIATRFRISVNWQEMIICILSWSCWVGLNSHS